MISPNQIERMVAAGAYARLVCRILDNGRCGSAEARARLAGPHTAPAAGLGLAAQRLCELTYRPSTMTARLVQRLLVLQRAGGLFGDGAAPSAAASAVALRGLLAWRGQLEEAHHVVEAALADAIEQAMAALTGMMSDASASPPGRLEAEIILWQLGQCEAFRQAIPTLAITVAQTDPLAGATRDDLARFAPAAAA